MEQLDTDFSKAMTQAVMEVMEGMAFMEILATRDEEAMAEAQNVLGVSLLVHEPVQWEFKLSIPLDLLGELAEAVFASPREELAPESLNDLMAEILNTVAGRFLTQILKDDQIYNLGLPEICPENSSNGDQPWKQWFFTADAKPFSIRILGTAPENLGIFVHTNTPH